jgi:pyruvate-formate lyase-activating enzyme
MMVNYAGKVDLSTVDWFGVGAYVIFFNRCPMRCPTCHNSQIRVATTWVDLKQITDGIYDCWPLLDHVVISGGEPLAQPEACRAIIKYCNDLDIKIAVETSGCLPLVEGFDMVFMDIKTSLEKVLYDSYTGFPGSFDSLMSNLAKMDPSRSEIRLVLFPESQFDFFTMGALRGFPVRISIGKGSGHGVVSQKQLREFGFGLYEYLDYSGATIETGRMLIHP